MALYVDLEEYPPCFSHVHLMVSSTPTVSVTSVSCSASSNILKPATCKTLSDKVGFTLMFGNPLPEVASGVPYPSTG